MKNKTKLHIVLGYANSGKTTTAWLVYLQLKKMGEVEFFQIFKDGWYKIKEKTETPAEDIQMATAEAGAPTNKPHDFCAIVVVEEERIAIFSAGDYALPIDNAFWWIEQVEPDVFVGCCHNHGNSNAKKSLNNHEKSYEVTHYYVDHENKEFDIEELKAKRKDLAQEIVDNIMNNNDKQDTMKDMLTLTRALVNTYKVEEINTLSALNVAEGDMISAQDVINIFKYVSAFNTNEYYVGITGRVREREKEHKASFLVVIDCTSNERANKMEELAKSNGFYTGGATGNGSNEDTTKLYIYKMIPGVTIEG
jgi:sulfur relay (sulfurtransferase) DsrF/TusC family protein